MRNTTRDFLNLYSELEKYVKNRYGTKMSREEARKPVYYLENLVAYSKYRDKIEYCRTIRNFLDHNPSIGSEFPVIASEAMIHFLSDLINDLKTLPTAEQKMIKEVCTRTPDNKLLPMMRLMREKNYTHIPIVQNDKVIGVFSESSILSFTIDHPDVIITDNTRVSDIMDYLRLFDRKAESFRFVPHDMLISEINIIFENAVKAGDRIGLIFVTNSGKETEKLLGILTAWDIASIQ